jgi:hypothetical protein
MSKVNGIGGAGVGASETRGVELDSRQVLLCTIVILLLCKYREATWNCISDLQIAKAKKKAGLLSSSLR